MPVTEAQTFFSINAGTDGFNLNMTNVPPLFPTVMVAPPPPPPPVCVPLRPGVEYIPVSPKRYRKAVKRYHKAMRHASPAVGLYLPGGIVVGTPAGYYYDDDDDYEDWLEDQYKHHKKKYKHYKKLKKHHKKHHHHWDD